MNYKITSTNVIISLLILVSMSVLCHLNRLASYITKKSEKFEEANNDPNKIYTRASCSRCIEEDKEFSRLYHQELDSADPVPCPNAYIDPCPDVLQSHPKIPEDIKSKCNLDVSKVTGIVSGESTDSVEDIISQEDYDDLLLKYQI